MKLAVAASCLRAKKMRARHRNMAMATGGGASGGGMVFFYAATAAAGPSATPSASAISSIRREKCICTRRRSTFARPPEEFRGRSRRAVRFRRAPRFADSRLAGKDQFGPVRCCPVLRHGPLRPEDGQVHLGRPGDHASDRHPDGRASSARSSAGWFIARNAGSGNLALEDGMTDGSIDILAQASFWLEPVASTSAQRHDTVFYTVLWVTGFFFALVVALMLSVHRALPPTERRAPPHRAHPQYAVGSRLDRHPAGRGHCDIRDGTARLCRFRHAAAERYGGRRGGRQWAFSFTYANGAVGDKLYLEVDRPVILQLHSADVLHAVYIPAFRVQRNAVPGRTTEMWVRPVRLGSYHIFCTQYCGDGHSRMGSEAVCSMRPAIRPSWRNWPTSSSIRPPRSRCPTRRWASRCTRATAAGSATRSTARPAPARPGWGFTSKTFAFSVAPPGYTLSASDSDAKWDAYLRQHILNPGATIVKGYQNVMQPFAPQFSGSPTKTRSWRP